MLNEVVVLYIQDHVHIWKESLSWFFYHCLETQNSYHWKKWQFKPWSYYEFGTRKGTSLRHYITALNAYIKDSNLKDDIRLNTTLTAFDSFKGLPKIKEVSEKNPAWKEGQFNFDKTYINNLLKRSRYKGKAALVEGFFDQSLTDNLRNSLKDKPPSIVNIDVDLYSSTKAVLNWLLPLLQNGTILYFDDVWEYLGSDERGELRAINEFNLQGQGKLINYYAHGIPSLFGKTYIYHK